MSKSEAKTKPTTKSVSQFLNGIDDEQKRKDCLALSKLMTSITKQEPKMWGESIVGFGTYHYKYGSGREGDSALTGFSPRKQNLTIYFTCSLEQNEDLMKKLGKYKISEAGSCLYIKKLSDIDQTVLKTLIEKSIAFVENLYK